MNTRPIVYRDREGEGVIIPPLTPEEDSFLAKVEAALVDDGVDDVAMAKLVWSEDNPLLENHPVTSQPFATRETYENPAFYRMLQLIDRKRELLGTLDTTAAESQYTMTVPEAAQAIGIHETSVRHAIRGHRLAAIKKSGSYYLNPASVDSYRVSTRGARAEVQFSAQAQPDLLPKMLLIREGTDGNYFLRVSGPSKNDSEKVAPDDVIKQCVISRWKRVAVLTGKKRENNYRIFILNPNPGESQSLTFAGFFVRGDFKVVKKINNPRQALEAWTTFEWA